MIGCIWSDRPTLTPNINDGPRYEKQGQERKYMSFDYCFTDNMRRLIMIWIHEAVKIQIKRVIKSVITYDLLELNPHTTMVVYLFIWMYVIISRWSIMW